MWNELTLLCANWRVTDVWEVWIVNFIFLVTDIENVIYFDDFVNVCMTERRQTDRQINSSYYAMMNVKTV